MIKFQVVEIFCSMQGEGFNTGRKAVFVRLAKCNLQCLWCDTDLSCYTEFSLEQIIEQVEKFNCMSVIITGGEPTYNDNMLDLALAFKQLGYWVALESNATNKIPDGIFDYIALSPKVYYKELYQKNDIACKADEIRIVVNGQSYEFCNFIQNKITANHYYLSPCCDKSGNFNFLETVELLGRLNMQPDGKKWYLSLQTHKFANIQ